MGETSEDFSEDGAEEGEYEDGENRSDDSQSNEGYDDDLDSASPKSMSNLDE